MQLTVRLCAAVRDFLHAEVAVMDEYEKALAALEEHRESDYYNRKTREAESERDEGLARARASASERLDPIMDAIERRLADKPIVPPTREMLDTLTLLGMRRNISADELKQAATLCSPCPAAIELLREIAAERGLPLQLAAPKTLSATVALEHAATARRTLDTLIYRPSEAIWSAAFLLNDDDGHLLGRLCGVWAGRDGQLSADYVCALRTALDGNAE